MRERAKSGALFFCPRPLFERSLISRGSILDDLLEEKRRLLAVYQSPIYSTKPGFTAKINPGALNNRALKRVELLPQRNSLPPRVKLLPWRSQTFRLSVFSNFYGFDQQRLIWSVFHLWDMVCS